MPIDADTYGYRRYLPHLVTSDATYFVTFCTFGRWILPPDAREVVLQSCIYDHRTLHWLHVATVMPDHVHLVTTPYENVKPAEVIGPIKSASAHIVKRVCGREGHVWFRESVRSHRAARGKPVGVDGST